MAYARRSRRTSRVRRSSGRDWFWAAPVQRVGRGGSDFGPYSVTRPGWSNMGDEVGDNVNYTNGLSRIYFAHGSTSYHREDSREARIRDRPWRVHWFEGQILLTYPETGPTTPTRYLYAGYLTMGAAQAIPRTEGSDIVSGILSPEGRGVTTRYLSIVSNTADSAAAVDRQRFMKLRIGHTVNPDQDWLINFHVDHVEGTVDSGSPPELLVHGRFRCSRT